MCILYILLIRFFNFVSVAGWMQRRFFTSSNRCDSHSEDQFSRSEKERHHRVDSTTKLFSTNKPVGGSHYNRSIKESSFVTTAEMEMDYKRLLKLHAEVQEEIKMLGKDKGESPNIASVSDFDSTSSPSAADLRQGSLLRRDAVPKGQEINPIMAMAEAVSDVSSDEMENYSQDRQSDHSKTGVHNCTDAVGTVSSVSSFMSGGLAASSDLAFTAAVSMAAVGGAAERDCAALQPTPLESALSKVIFIDFVI